ncbi:MAG: translation elongation factor Ts [Actinomycetaceae bacterium]|nr:translation elongation factor Ts [Actinomycetaceae bacterium]
MANYTTQDIKELREATGAGMMDVKKALDEANGDREEALKIIRIKGQKSLSKREGRATGAGLIAAGVIDTPAGQRGTLVEVKSETDFVAKNDKFIEVADKVLKAALDSGADTVEGVLAAKVDGETAKDVLEGLAAVIGERLELASVAQLEGDKVALYLHRTSKDLPPQVGVLVATDAAGAEIGRDIAMHITANTPAYTSREDIPADDLARERTTLEEATRAEGKPEAAVAKIVEGKLNGFFKDNVLLDQPYARDTKLSVSQVLEQAKAKVTGFARIRVGE